MASSTEDDEKEFGSARKQNGKFVRKKKVSSFLRQKERKAFGKPCLDEKERKKLLAFKRRKKEQTP